MRCPPEATGEGGATQEQGVAAEAHRHQSRRDLAAMRPGLTGATEFGDRQEQETPTGEGDRDQAGGELREISHHPPPGGPAPSHCAHKPYSRASGSKRRPQSSQYASPR